MLNNNYAVLKSEKQQRQSRYVRNVNSGSMRRTSRSGSVRRSNTPLQSFSFV
jgi:hypothetical protein